RIYLSYVIVYSSLHPSSTRHKARNTIIPVDNMHVCVFLLNKNDGIKQARPYIRPIREYRHTFYCKSAGYMHKL
ncbi:MAG: hypothetical protein QN720_10110, partial [Nitrososphaeraceae archaeon]|nr:hypothetical protein [Nitrososphaeraceae archaeon]